MLIVSILVHLVQDLLVFFFFLFFFFFVFLFLFFFFFKQKTAYEISACLVGSEMCIRDRVLTDGRLRDWPALPEAACPSLLVDLESGPLRLGKAERLARELGAEYRHISELNEI